jgi:predicted AAA+ superfamily ATPase
MLTTEQISSIILENQDFIKEVQVVKRDSVLETQASYVICGPRRAGKSYRLYQFIKENFVANGQLERVLYINFEDERFLEATTADLDNVLKAYAQLYAHDPVIFLDEVHRIAGWDKFVRRLRDKHTQVLVTGSNAAMLSRDVTSTLGGRLMIRDQYPFSFHEYLRLREIELKENFLVSRQASEITRVFPDYFHEGGFAETLNYQHRQEFLSNLYQHVVYGDLILRNKLRNEVALKLLIKRLAENIGDECSYRRIHRLLEATGTDLSLKSLIDYIGYLEDAYLILPLINFTRKFAERESARKYYFIDNGLLFLFQRNNDAQLLENLVFLDLKRRYTDSVSYLKEKYEVDFYLPDERHLIQVCYDLGHPETRERELRGLEYFGKKYSVQSMTIVTRDQEESIVHNETQVEVVPVWKWLLRT